MAKNTIDDLRNHLFATIEGLQDPDSPFPIEKALAISKVAQTIIDSAKVEVKLLETTGGDVASDFFAGKGRKQPALPPPALVKRH